MSTTAHFRAYLNPQPALSEAAQKALVAPYIPSATYIESRGETREDWIGSLRVGDLALVPELFTLAKATGRKDARFRDLMVARDEIHDVGGVIVEASTGHRSDNKVHWRMMRDRAEEMLAGAVKAGVVGRKPHGYTPDELAAMRAIKDSRAFDNWKAREDAILLRGIKAPGRTWFYEKLPALTDHLARAVEPAKPAKKRPQLVYFIQSGNTVKIGLSASPKDRLKSMATGNHGELRLLATAPGRRKREMAFHARFSDDRIKGEWFELSPAIKKCIAGLKSARKRKR